MLDDLTILQCGDTAASLMAAGLFSDLGARVAILEASSGSPLRGNPAFQVWARGTSSIAVSDRRHEFRELASRFDVVLVDAAEWEAAGQPRGRRVTAVVESGLPDWAPWNSATAAAPEIAASIAEAFGGFLYTQQGFRDGPFFLVDPAASYGCALLTNIGVLAALYATAPDGSELVRTSHLAGSLGMIYFSSVAGPGEIMSGLPIDGDPKRVSTPLIRFYEASDGWLVIGAVSAGTWAKMCLALDTPEMLVDPRFEGAPFDIPEASWRAGAIETIAAKIRRKTVAEWLAVFRENDVVAGPVLEPGVCFDVPQVAAIGMRWTVDVPDVGKIVAPGVPVQLADGEPLVPMRAPQIGEHSVDWLAAGLDPGADGSIPPIAHRGAPPLSGVRVVDFGTIAAAPGIGRQLAGLGADVVKVEAPGGDPIRGLAYTFASVNRGKRAIVGDLNRANTRLDLEQLIAGADVVIHNFREAVRERLHLSRPELVALNNDVIECAVTGYGEGGPDTGLPSLDVVLEALTGAPIVQGGGGEPVGYSGGASDNGTMLMGTFATLAALYRRRRGAPGLRHVSVSLAQTALYRHAEMLVLPLSRWRDLTMGVDPVGPSAAHRLYRCADEWVLLAVSSHAQWRALSTFDDRLPNEFAPSSARWNEATAGILEPLLAERQAAEIVAWCQGRAIPVTLAQSFASFARQANQVGSGLVNVFDDPKWGSLIGLNELIQFEGSAVAAVSPPPMLGSTDLHTVRWHDTGAQPPNED